LCGKFLNALAILARVFKEWESRVKKTGGQGDRETGRQGDKETRRQGGFLNRSASNIIWLDAEFNKSSALGVRKWEALLPIPLFKFYPPSSKKYEVQSYPRFL